MHRSCAARRKPYPTGDAGFAVRAQRADQPARRIDVRSYETRVTLVTSRHTQRPIDQVFDHLRREIPDLVVERLQVTHAGDDDNVYFVGDGSRRDRIQIDTAPGGQPPFVIENGGRSETSTLAEAFRIIKSWLRQGRPPT